MQPPQNPYESGPNLNKNGDALPNSGQPLPNPAPSPQSGGVSVDAITEAWNVIKPQIGVWLGVALVYFLIAGAFNGIQFTTMGRDANGMPQNSPISLLVSVVGTIVSLFLAAGLFKVAIHQLRTGRAEFGEMFNIFDQAGALVVAAILTAIATWIGFVLCIIPGIIVGLGLSMTNPLIVDQKLAGIDAMKRSWDVCKGELGNIFLVGLVLFLVNMAGACLCGLGLLMTIPISYMTFAIIYRNLFLGGTMGQPSAQSNALYPPPPIASP